MSSSDGLRVRGLSAAWDRVPVVSQVSLDVGPGEFVVLMGPNGSGKSTLLRCLAGLEEPTEGSVMLGGRDLGKVPAHRRGIGLLFQEPALFPHRSVWQNIAYGPAVQRLAPPEIERRVGEVSELLHLVPLLGRRPSALSGGERQRVALARTLAARPAVVLLDEPFAAVDPEARGELRADFRRALSQSGVGVLHVTHDREEGLFLGDRVVVLFGGRIRQSGAPGEVYAKPVDSEVARFLGYNVVRFEGATQAIEPRETQWGAEGTGRLEADVLATGSVGAERVTLLQTDEGDRIELRSPPAQAPPADRRRLSVTWVRSIPLER